MRRFKTFIYCIAVLVIIFFYVAVFQNFKGFPTGDDPAQHIMWAKSFMQNTYPPSFLNASPHPSPYPLSEVLFTVLHIFTQISLEKLFIIITLGVVLFSALLVSQISYFLFGHLARLFTLFIAAGMPFLLMTPVIGLMGEIYGKFMLFLTIYCILRKKLFFSLFLILFLYLAHPISGLIMLALILTIIPFIFFTKYKTIINFIKINKYIIIMLIVMLFFSVLVFRKNIMSSNLIFYLLNNSLIAREDISYSLPAIINRIPLLFGFYCFAVLGYVFFAGKNRNKFQTILLFLLPILVFLLFNNKLDLNIVPYRFISFFELLIAVFSGYGLFIFYKHLIKNKFTNINKSFVAVITVIILIFLISNNTSYVNEVLANFNKPGSRNKLPQEDMRAMEWINKNISSDRAICASWKWGYWILPLSQKVTYIAEMYNNCHIVMSSRNLGVILKSAKEGKFDYTYFSSGQKINPVFYNQNYFKEIYRSNNVAIFEILNK